MSKRRDDQSSRHSIEENSKQKAPASRSRLLSGIAGGIMLGGGILWFSWILLHQHGISTFPIFMPPGQVPVATYPAVVQSPPLLAEGITLGQPSQPPVLNQQQAYLLANSLEPDAATRAKSTSAQYALLNYPANSASVSHPDFVNVPTWLIVYQMIPLEPADASVDPTPYPHSFHDLYVFLDANNGKELLAIWI